jgi:hypothetical protein
MIEQFQLTHNLCVNNINGNDLTAPSCGSVCRETWNDHPTGRASQNWDGPHILRIVVARFLTDIARDAHGDERGCIFPNRRDIIEKERGSHDRNKEIPVPL